MAAICASPARQWISPSKCCHYALPSAATPFSAISRASSRSPRSKAAIALAKGTFESTSPVIQRGFARSTAYRRQDAPERRSPGRLAGQPNSDNRLSCAAFLRTECGHRIVEGRNGADVRPDATVAHALDDLAQLGAIRLYDEINRQAVDGPRLDRTDDRHQGPSGTNQKCRSFPDLRANQVEDQIDLPNIFENVVLKVYELVCAEVERLLAIRRAPGADHIGA